ncbi:hypothetical protein C8J57DRAFT_1519119 [Mycena rebaudengoi]|nr:hypothetical protein C8J57DRAFT_1519119 [Mycena rebaudengoi]
MHSARLEYANLLIPFDELHWAATQGPFPSLRGLTLGASHYNGPKDAVVAFCDAPTLTTLTTISVGDWETSQVAYILRNAVSVVNFSATSLILSEQGYWGRGTRKLLDALTAPALRHLAISSPTLSFDIITSFLTRSQCLLESLHVTRCKLHPRNGCEEADVRAIFPLIKVVKVFVDNENDED